MSIADHVQKIKNWISYLDQRDIYTALLIVFCSLASYGLGRLSFLEGERTPIMIEQKQEQTASVTDALDEVTATQEGSLVASKNGTRYYLPWCGSVRNISEENRVWFASKELAEKAGYKPATNCKGL